ncbi:MAG: hypothetical protein JWM59_2778 [Verrucomicrobiales bacterium]|nr:hypothetical protein [Verrucomicrobiales bacterium]
MSDLLSQLPAVLVQFLRANGGRTIRFDPSVMPQMQMDAVEFRTPDELKLSSFEVDTGEYYENHGETGEDPDLQYLIEGIGAFP